jgi:iron complex transport system substrate-binding protein
VPFRFLPDIGRLQAGRAFALLLAPLVLAAPARAVDRVVSLNLCTDQLAVLLAPEKVAGLTPLARDPALSFVAAQAARLPIVRPSAEAVMALRPDLILGARFGAQTTLALLAQSGYRVERLDLPVDFPGIRIALRTAAAILGVPERAGPSIAAMDAALPRLLVARTPPVNALVWEPRGWTSGPGGLMDAVLRAAGLVDAGSGGQVGLEALLRHRPDLLVLPDSGAGPSLATDMLRHPAVLGIPVRTVPVALTICAGPFTADAVEQVAR